MQLDDKFSLWYDAGDLRAMKAMKASRKQNTQKKQDCFLKKKEDERYR